MYIRHIYDIDLCAPDGKIVRMRNYEGYIVMVVNTASECGFNDQLEEMEMCYELFKGHRFVILAFPSDQFNQEPLDDEDMITHNEAHYQVSFPMFRKVIVNGRQAHPLFRYLTNALPGILGTQSIKWNFTKFLVDRDGNVVKRYAPSTKPEAIASDIEALL